MKLKPLVFLTVLSSFFFALQSNASIDVLMKLEGKVEIPKAFSSKSQTEGFTDGYITILGASSGFAVPVQDAGSASRAVSKPSYSEFSVVKWADEITPVLTLLGVSGQSLDKVTVVWVSSGGEVQKTASKRMEFIMENVFVSGAALSGGQGEERGTESVSFSWGKMTIQSYIVDSKGATTPGPKVVIDAAKNTASN